MDARDHHHQDLEFEFTVKDRNAKCNRCGYEFKADQDTVKLMRLHTCPPPENVTVNDDCFLTVLGTAASSMRWYLAGSRVGKTDPYEDNSK